MIDQNNFKQLLELLGFAKNDTNNIYTKNYTENSKAYLQVNFKEKKLIYPKEVTIGGEFTTNFTSNENFVVFECVNRLFEKGYKPEHIELEPKWKLGHGASGGRADILIKDNNNDTLLIIECKTAGKEFLSEWNNTLKDGGQLFSYVKQTGSVKFVCLYASDIDNNVIKYESNIINLSDNKNFIKESNNKELMTFEKALSLEVRHIYKAWKETYKLDYQTKGIFENDIQAYHIGKEKYSIEDLSEVSDTDIQKKYHHFATIMRKYNVSGRENAFDKLVNLFLCKVVDEKNNPDELKFYWKGIAYDSFFDLQDRLQLLYRDGMKDFLGEDVVYINNADIKKAFKYVKNDPDATQDTIINFFFQQKFFTNNDFAFIDVHNESLFYQNAQILLDVLKMLQDTKIKTDKPNQFLGDMFEGFLDQGIKQSEGQFFTPMPIVKFIINSLPLEKIIKNSNHLSLPKAIDYACGAGHFLNELALQMTSIIKKENTQTNIKDYYKNIVGIEKEYRLSKVAKVSAFMYGQDDITIKYADALSKESNLEEKDYSILVANPPYAVKGFLDTLSEEDRDKYSLSKNIDDKSINTNNNIEAFFIERAKQILKSGGVAGIVLPSSILSNDSAVYTNTREILLKYFSIVAIVEFGSGTFGKTGTNTVTLFIERKDENPNSADHWKNRVNSWFNNSCENNKIYEDFHFVLKYCNHIGVNQEEYKSLLNGEPSKELLKYDMFCEYEKDFNNSIEIKNLLKQKQFNDKTKEDKEKEIYKRFTQYLKEKEKDKLYFYILACENNRKVLLVKSPSDGKEQKQFLGYEWSSAKGNEGIKYINQLTISKKENNEDEEVLTQLKGILNINTPLYNPNQRYDTKKINYYIEKNFIGENVEIDEQLTKYVSYNNLCDLLDFNRTNFNKQISLSPKKNNNIQTKWDLEKIEKIIDVLESGSRPEGGVGNINSGVLSLGGEHIHPYKGIIDLTKPKYVPIDFFNNANRGKLKNNDILICKDGALTGKIALLRNDLNKIDAMVNEHLFIIRCNDITKQFYLFHYLMGETGQEIIKENITGSAQGGLNSTNLKNIKIPLPPKEIQDYIVKECEEIDTEMRKAEEQITKNKKEIDQIIETLKNKNHKEVKIGEYCNVSAGGTPKREVLEYWNGNINWLRSEVCQNTYVYEDQVNEKITLLGLEKSSAKLLNKDTVLMALVGATIGKIAYLTFESSTNQNIAGINPIDKKILISKYLYYILINDYDKNFGDTKGKFSMINLSNVRELKIILPPKEEQERIVKEIEAKEDIIKQNKQIISDAPKKKEDILKKYL